MNVVYLKWLLSKPFIYIYLGCLDQEENIISHGPMRKESMKWPRELALPCFVLFWWDYIACCSFHIHKFMYKRYRFFKWFCRIEKEHLNIHPIISRACAGCDWGWLRIPAGHCYSIVRGISLFHSHIYWMTWFERINAIWKSFTMQFCFQLCNQKASTEIEGYKRWYLFLDILLSPMIKKFYIKAYYYGPFVSQYGSWDNLFHYCENCSSARH